VGWEGDNARCSHPHEGGFAKKTEPRGAVQVLRHMFISGLVQIYFSMMHKWFLLQACSLRKERDKFGVNRAEPPL
jgi:hypothetical protein